jgi:phage terminase small subunit
MLETAAEALDQALEAEKILARDGLVTTTGQRGPRQHPAVNISRDARNRLLAAPGN